eukprot:365946-Chlamydomonas_euryale.AAC.2
MVPLFCAHASVAGVGGSKDADPKSWTPPPPQALPARSRCRTHHHRSRLTPAARERESLFEAYFTHCRLGGTRHPLRAGRTCSTAPPSPQPGPRLLSDEASALP